MLLKLMLLSGENVAEEDNTLRSQLAKTEISLTLTNKHEIPDSSDADAAKLLVRYLPVTLLHYFSALSGAFYPTLCIIIIM